MTGRANTAKIALALWSIAFFASEAQAQKDRPRLEVELDRSSIFEGESFLLTIKELDVQAPKEPDLSHLEDFRVERLGERSLNSSQIMSINGRVTERREFGHMYQYRLTPTRTGTLTLPAIDVEVDGEVLSSRDYSVVVRAPEEQDFVIAKVKVEPESVYPLKPFAVSLRVFVKRLPGRHRPRDPLEPLRNSPPHLSIPWVELPDGLVAETPFKDWLTPLLARRRSHGFQINDVTSGGGFFSFFDDRKAVFDLSGRVATESDVADIPRLRGKADEYQVYTLSRTLIPERSGTFEFGSVAIKGRFAVDLRGGDLIGGDIYAISDRSSIVVKSVPEEGRPDSFTGAVGTFSLDASVAPSKARVGDPMTLTLSLRGQGNLEDVGPPRLEDIPAMTDAFRVYEATTETKGAKRLFIYALRPLRADVQQIPSIAFSYFDVNRERYVTIETDPLPIEVEAAKTLDQSDIVSADRKTPEGPGLAASAEGVFANFDVGDMRDDSVSPVDHVLYWIGLTVVSVGTGFVVQQRRRRLDDPRLIRKRKAVSKAKGSLAQAKELIGKGDVHDGAVTLRAAFFGLVADIFGLPEAGVSRRVVEERLVDLGVDETLRTRVRELVDDCDAVSFGAIPEGFVTKGEKALELMDELVVAIRQAKGFK